MYIGFLTAESDVAAAYFVEPTIESGYTRIPLHGILSIPLIGYAENIHPIYFPRACGDGYGEISHIVFFESLVADIPIGVIELDGVIGVPAGTAPIFDVGAIKISSW